jgi:guanyl-specific ribonuclease Sa
MVRNIFIIIALVLGILFFEYFSSQSGQVSTPILKSGSTQAGYHLIESWSIRTLTGMIVTKVQKILQDPDVIKALDRIDHTNPKYNQDNAIFSNRERVLQVESDKSYYREWTVETPGSPDRWPRRIIVGKRWEIYFTSNHYRSFTRIH